MKQGLKTRSRVKACLVVIDVQNYFLNEHSKDIPSKIRQYLSRSKSAYDFVVFTKFVNHDKSPFYKALNFKDCLGGKEVEIAEELDSFLKSDNVFVKDTYSIFENEDFQKFIEINKLTSFDLCGLTSDGCVLAAAFDGFDRGFNVKVLGDLTGTCWGPSEFNQSCLNLMGYKIDPNLLEKNKSL